jgi:hypothetical protein
MNNNSSQWEKKDQTNPEIGHRSVEKIQIIKKKNTQ